MQDQPIRALPSRRHFAGRLLRHLLGSGLLITGSLAVGVIGYHAIEHLSWVDSLLNASMIMGGMGPVDPMKTTAGKLFASAYALYCGLVLLVSAGILLAPALHRFLHRFHLEMSTRNDE
jgi:hypothetical protein